MEIGKRIKQERLRAGLTQKELAEMTGITIRTISGLECGDRDNASLSTLKKVEKALGLPSGYLNMSKEDQPSVLLGISGDDPKTLLDANLLLENAKVFFAGGSLSDDTKQKFMEALLQSYLESRK